MRRTHAQLNEPPIPFISRLHSLNEPPIPFISKVAFNYVQIRIRLYREDSKTCASSGILAQVKQTEAVGT